jgi:hypothetical protein
MTMGMVTSLSLAMLTFAAVTGCTSAQKQCDSIYGTYFVDRSDDKKIGATQIDDSYIIDFAEEEGRLIYRSWLHERPADSGTYAQTGCALTVKTASLTISYEIVRLEGNQLWLKDKSDGTVEKFYNRNE